MTRILAAAAAIHDELEALGFSHAEIVGILGAGMGYSLAQLSLEDRARYIAAHLAGLRLLGIDIDQHGRVVVRQP